MQGNNGSMMGGLNIDARYNEYYELFNPTRSQKLPQTT
jgi:hypothetical protein